MSLPSKVCLQQLKLLSHHQVRHTHSSLFHFYASYLFLGFIFCVCFLNFQFSLTILFFQSQLSQGSQTQQFLPIPPPSSSSTFLLNQWPCWCESALPILQNLCFFFFPIYLRKLQGFSILNRNGDFSHKLLCGNIAEILL